MKFGTLSSKFQAVGRSLKRFWPMPVFFGIFLLLLLSGEYLDEPKDLWYYNIYVYGFFMACYGILCAILLFGDLFTARYATAVHSLPVTREGLFLNNLLSGFAMFLLPAIPTFLLALVKVEFSVTDTLYWLGPQIAMWLYGYAIGALGCTLSGTVFGSIAMTGLLAFGIPMAEGLLGGVVHELLVGIPEPSGCTTFLSPIINIMNFYGEDASLNYFWGVLIACVPLLLLALLLYRKRELEVAGDFVAFPKTKPYIKGCATFLIGLMLGGILNEIFMWNIVFQNRLLSVLLWLLPGVLIARVATEMVVEKTVRVVSKKHLLRYGVCLLAAAGLTTLVWLDIPGVQTRVPDVEDVASVEVQSTYRSNVFLLEDPENIAAATELHKKLTENLEYCTNNYALMHTRVCLFYTMKDGSTLTREYNLKDIYSDYGDYGYFQQIFYDISAFCNDPDIAFASLIGADCSPEEVYDYLTDVSINIRETEVYYSPDPQDTAGLMEAIYKDLFTGGAYIALGDVLDGDILYVITIDTDDGWSYSDDVWVTDPDGAVAQWVEENLPKSP